ncbi:MAG: prepilin-type N-terminal cleavage/methylation domain-containing protein [Candidatus Calescibacterium sp.]|nr:prepilin-type N-terminal cleavage/methylation domain-containing protein [Candidatus Calescibacterium sp.]MCX7972401.1 prepilin-type N-terminal cleavage/methylation domain-containing protein [bacterium]MDW8195708.1 prepilin-type N-terminal cleavage/methylation domain-containing protein [Candidatus Calescibacterium sp.]
MKKHRRGLTLIELITVVAIIAILAATLLPYAFGRLEDGKISRTEEEISSLRSAVAMFFNDTSTFPTKWIDLVTPPQNLSNWRGPYINKLPNTSSAVWTEASAWKTDYRLWSLVGATTDNRFGSNTNLYPFRNAIALEITNPSPPSPIPLTSLQKIDTDLDNNNASSGFIIEANSNTSPFVPANSSMAGLTTGANYTGGGKSVYILLFTY